MVIGLIGGLGFQKSFTSLPKQPNVGFRFDVESLIRIVYILRLTKLTRSNTRVLGQTTGGPFSTHGLRHDVAEMQFHPSFILAVY